MICYDNKKKFQSDAGCNARHGLHTNGLHHIAK